MIALLALEQCLNIIARDIERLAIPMYRLQVLRFPESQMIILQVSCPQMLPHKASPHCILNNVESTCLKKYPIDSFL